MNDMRRGTSYFSRACICTGSVSMGQRLFSGMSWASAQGIPDLPCGSCLMDAPESPDQFGDVHRYKAINEPTR
jgi:hypothetical protein